MKFILPAKFALMLIPISLALATLAQAQNSTASKSAFTIEQALSAPFPTDLVAAPAKNRVAWVFNSQGRRNIWIAEPSSSGSFKSRPLTSYTEDDGQDLGELSWSPDAETIVYTRGGDLEFNNKPEPNPASSPQAMEQAVWAVSLSGGEPRKIGEGHSPSVSPKGGSVAYILKNQIWIARLDGSSTPEQLLHAGGEEESLRWSPDGAKLAFVSHRTGHGFIGVYDLAAKSVIYLDPSVDSDSEPVWSPDSSQIAFIRIPVSKSNLVFSPKREGTPWSIYVADSSTGKARQIWRAEPGQGSVFHEIVAENQLFWTSRGNLIVFPWERDGWAHLYSISADGGSSAKLLTPGNFEVEFVNFGHPQETIVSRPPSSLGRIVYSSNQDDIDRRHIWEVSPAGDPPKSITRGSGIETYPVVTSDSHSIVVLRSDALLPLRPASIPDSGGVIIDFAPESIPAQFPAQALVTPQQIILAAADGLVLHAQLFLPPHADDGAKHPALVFFHGGSRRQMLLGWHYMGYYSNAYAMNQFLASRGYIVLAVNYRSGIGYGLDFREALNYGATGASEFNDVLGAGLYLRSRPDVDPHRIGLWGGSYGGYLTALGLARASDLFSAGVDMHGVHDWNTEIPNFSAGYKPDAHPDAARLAWESSPLASISTWRSPVLLIQGDDDRNVPFTQMIDLVEALRKQKVEFEQIVFPDEIHDFLLFRSWVRAYSAASDFFGRHFHPGSAPAPPADR
ncbi:MAG: prolyl oligopeptidase family serine peptidase [Candidatus Acidiferrales bacterium]